MKARDFIVTIREMSKDTLRQSLSSGVFWLLLGVTVLTTMVCGSVTVSGEAKLSASTEFMPRHDMELGKDKHVPVINGDLTLAFGGLRIPLGRDRADAVHFLQLVLAGGIADTMGVLLAILWTAGFLPNFLSERSIAVLLSKPAPRWSLLLGKYVGVLAFVLFHATLFVFATWTALGVRTGVWNTSYLLALPLLMIQVAVFFSFSALLATMTRSTVVSVVGTIAFWLLCWGINYGRATTLAASYATTAATPMAGFASMIEISYWLLPKPGDLGYILFQSLEGDKAFGSLSEFTLLQQHGDFHPLLAILTSLLTASFLFVAAVREFETTDY